MTENEGHGFDIYIWKKDENGVDSYFCPLSLGFGNSLTHWAFGCLVLSL